jgi:hypothetical protein
MLSMSGRLPPSCSRHEISSASQRFRGPDNDGLQARGRCWVCVRPAFAWPLDPIVRPPAVRHPSAGAAGRGHNEWAGGAPVRPDRRIDRSPATDTRPHPHEHMDSRAGEVGTARHAPPRSGSHIPACYSACEQEQQLLPLPCRCSAGPSRRARNAAAGRWPDGHQPPLDADVWVAAPTPTPSRCVRPDRSPSARPAPAQGELVSVGRPNRPTNERSTRAPQSQRPAADPAHGASERDGREGGSVSDHPVPFRATLLRPLASAGGGGHGAQGGGARATGARAPLPIWDLFRPCRAMPPCPLAERRCSSPRLALPCLFVCSRKRIE